MGKIKQTEKMAVIDFVISGSSCLCTSTIYSYVALIE